MLATPLRPNGSAGPNPLTPICEPTTLAIASLALTATAEGASLIGQSQQAKAQTEHQAELSKANNAEAGNQLSQLMIQQAQERESTARDSEKARLASQKSKSTALVAAGEASVQGNSVDAMLQEYDMNLGQFKEATRRQQSWGDQQSSAHVDAVLAGANYRGLDINAPVVGPNYAAAAVRVAGAAASTRYNYLKDTGKIGKAGK